MEVVELQAGTYLPKESIFFSDKKQLRTVAVIEAGAHAFMLIILRITMDPWGNYRLHTRDIMVLTYYYFNHSGCIVGSISLCVYVSKMDIGRIRMYIKCSSFFYVIFTFVSACEMLIAEFPNVYYLPVVIWLVLYKFLSLVIVYAFQRRWRKFSTSNSELSDADIEAFHDGCTSRLYAFPANSFDSLPYNKAYEIPFENLSLTSILLGKGSFGQVFKATLSTGSAEEHLTVAVKTIESCADDCYFRSLLAELKILSSAGKHEHIVNLIGACTGELKQRKVYIVVEYCAHGSIDKYIQVKRGFFQDMIVDDQIIASNNNNNYTQLYEVTTLDILKWAYQTARGMEYLANKNIIHGDIAARNILLTENLSIKIADFGLSRHLYDQLNYVKKQSDPLPWRWMAPESLCSREFSTKTDVWAYAVTLWEFFTLCELPFREHNWSAEFVDLLKSGYRLQRPVFSTSGIYELMWSCWQLDPKCRPRFGDICEYFAKIIDAVQTGSSYCCTNVTVEPESSLYNFELD